MLNLDKNVPLQKNLDSLLYHWHQQILNENPSAQKIESTLTEDFWLFYHHNSNNNTIYEWYTKVQEYFKTKDDWALDIQNIQRDLNVDLDTKAIASLKKILQDKEIINEKIMFSKIENKNWNMKINVTKLLKQIYFYLQAKEAFHKLEVKSKYLLTEDYRHVQYFSIKNVINGRIRNCFKVISPINKSPKNLSSHYRQELSLIKKAKLDQKVELEMLNSLKEHVENKNSNIAILHKKLLTEYFKLQINQMFVQCEKKVQQEFNHQDSSNHNQLQKDFEFINKLTNALKIKNLRNEIKELIFLNDQQEEEIQNEKDHEDIINEINDINEINKEGETLINNVIINTLKLHEEIKDIQEDRILNPNSNIQTNIKEFNTLFGEMYKKYNPFY